MDAGADDDPSVFPRKRTTNGDMEWLWVDDSFSFENALLFIEFNIAKFEYTYIKEIDPVDAWAIIGAIGGVWRECVQLLILQ